MPWTSSGAYNNVCYFLIAQFVGWLIDMTSSSIHPSHHSPPRPPTRARGAKAGEMERRVQVRVAQLELKHQEEVRAVKRQYEERIERMERALLPPTPPKAGPGSKSRGKGGGGLSASAAALAVAGGPAANSEAAALILSAREMANSKVGQWVGRRLMRRGVLASHVINKPTYIRTYVPAFKNDRWRRCRRSWSTRSRCSTTCRCTTTR